LYGALSVKTGKEDNLEKETAAAMANQKSSSGKTHAYCPIPFQRIYLNSKQVNNQGITLYPIQPSRMMKASRLGKETCSDCNYMS